MSAALAVSSRTGERRLPAVVALTMAFVTCTVYTARLDCSTKVRREHLNIDGHRARNDFRHTHPLRWDAKKGGHIAHEVLFIKELLNCDLDAERENNLVDRTNLQSRHPTTNDNVDFIFPCREGIGTARVVRSRLDHREVVRTAHGGSRPCRERMQNLVLCMQGKHASAKSEHTLTRA